MELEILTAFVNPKQFEKRNYFEKTVLGNSFETIFSDDEAFSICSGVSNRRKARNVWIKYCNNSIKEKDILDAHKIALEALDIYGIKNLNLIMGLQPLNFFDNRVHEAFSEFDKKVNSETTTQVHIKAKTFFQFLKDDSEYTIRFLTKKNNRDFNYLEVLKKNNTPTYTKKVTAKILLSRKDNKIFSDNNKPIPNLMLKILFSFLESPKSFIVNFGNEILECKRCGALLTATKSLNVNHGPTCAKHLGISY